MSYKNIAKELGIHHSVVSRWVKHFEAIEWFLYILFLTI
ncbi:helix-turn-helix domain-containing protein [Bacillus thuringiensis]|nr:helix-turn-helix domain-containing protein [Bacillus thuringiensis]UYX55516.1 helix-turn-helix domain-containing protein [Bacillus thuringiensis]